MYSHQSIDKECMQRRNWKVDVLAFVLETIVRKEFVKVERLSIFTA